MPFTYTQDEIQIRYNSVGTGAPVLLLSGQAQDSRLWQYAIPLFAQYYQVITLDYRGTGQSDKPNQPYSTEHFALDALAVLNALNIQRAHIYGISMGGRVAQHIGIHFPERVNCLILGATTCGKGGIPRDAQTNAWLQSGDVKKITSLMYSDTFAQQHPELLIPHPTPAFARRLHYLASEQHNTCQELHTIQANTLILHGSDDRINPTENAYQLAKIIPHSTLHIIQGGKHGYLDEYLEETFAVMHNYLNQSNDNKPHF